MRPSSGAPSGTPAASAGETAGTVKSFEGGVLTIELTDHSTVSGRVTEATELRCESAGAPGEDGEDGPGESSHVGGARDAAVRSSSSGEDGEDGGDHEEGNDGEDDDGPSGGPPPSCTTAALVPGAVVAEAELSVGSGGAVWDQVELIL